MSERSCKGVRRTLTVRAGLHKEKAENMAAFVCDVVIVGIPEQIDDILVWPHALHIRRPRIRSKVRLRPPRLCQVVGHTAQSPRIFRNAKIFLNAQHTWTGRVCSAKITVLLAIVF